MKDYKALLHWVVCKEPRFDFEARPVMVVWLKGDNHYIEGETVEDMIESGIKLEAKLKIQDEEE